MDESRRSSLEAKIVFTNEYQLMPVRSKRQSVDDYHSQSIVTKNSRTTVAASSIERRPVQKEVHSSMSLLPFSYSRALLQN